MPRSTIARFALIAAVIAGVAAPAAMLAQAARAAVQDDPGVPYVPTPPAVVEAMLDLAQLQTGERLIDLGSGDGRIVVAAARRGANALGVERNPRLVSRARMLADMNGAGDGARFVRDDLFAVSLHDADVVTLYLLPEVNLRLRPKLLTELPPGARVVSHGFDMGDWPPDGHEVVAEKNLYLWIIPAVAGGAWRLTRADGSTARLEIEQRYSRITGTLDGRPIAEPRLRGARLSFVADGVRYDGVVGDRTIAPADGAAAGWRAERAL